MKVSSQLYSLRAVLRRCRLVAIPLAVLLLALCVHKATDPTGDDLKDEYQLKGSISGTVRSAATDLALSGVTVTTDSGGYSSTSDSLGAYSIPDVVGRTYTLSYTHAHYFDTTMDSVGVAIDEDVTGIDAWLRPRPEFFRGSISGTVRNAVTNRALSGVSITTDSGGYTSTSDSLGRFTVPDVIASLYTLTFTHAHYFDTTADSVSIGLSQLLTGIDVGLRPRPEFFRGSISGTVRDAESHAAISGASVTADSGGYTTTSDSSGSYTIPDVIPSTYTVSFAHSQYYDTSLASITVALSADVESIDASMRRKAAYFTGAIRGIVMDSVTRTPLTSVVVATNPGGYTATSGSGGSFIIIEVPFGNYRVAASVNHYSNAIDSVSVAADDTTDLSDTLWAVRQDVLVREISGQLTGNTADVFQVEATVTGDSINPADPVVANLTWLPISKTYTGNIFVPQQGLVWQVEIRVYDDQGRVIAYQSMAFDKGAATVAMPATAADNGKPQLFAGPDTTVTIGDSVHLHAFAVDSIGPLGLRSSLTDMQSVLSWEWQFGESGLFIASAPDTTITAPLSYVASYPCIARVSDDEGNRVTDTVMVTVKTAIPLASAGADTTVSINDSVHVRGTATDSLSSTLFLAWDIDADGKFESSGATAAFKAPATETVRSCVFRVTDDDGNVVYDTMQATVITDAPVANAGVDTSVDLGDPVRLHGSASQTFGSVVSWEWSINSGSFLTTISGTGDTTITVPAYYRPRHPCVLRVTDDDGNVAYDTTVLTVGYQWDIMGGTGVSTNEVRSINIESDPRVTDRMHVSYVDGYTTGKVHDKLWSGAAWTEVGISPISEGLNTVVALALTLEMGCGTSCVPYESPFIAYVNEGAFDSAVVKHTTSWTRIQGAIHPGSGSICWGIGLEAINSSAVYLAFIDLSPKLYLKVYFGGTSTPWALSGGKIVDSSVTNLAFDMESDKIGGKNIPHLAYLQGVGSGDNTCTVKKYSGGTWTSLGSSWTTGEDPADYGTIHTIVNSDPSIVVTNDTPYVAYVDPLESNGATVKKFDGAGWVTVGQSNLSDGPAKAISLAGFKGQLFIVYLDVSVGNRITVKHFDGQSWVTVGQRGFTSQNMREPVIGISNAGTSTTNYLAKPHVAFADADNGYRLTIMRLR